MDATTARETLHGWIDDADDATVVSLAELLDSLTTRGLLALAKPQPDRVSVPFTMKADDTPAQPTTYVIRTRPPDPDHEKRRRHADWLARRGFMTSMRATPEQFATWLEANPEPEV